MRLTVVDSSPAYSDELRHYGIIGMRWGVRRTPEELGHKPASKSGARDYNREISRQTRQETAARVNTARYAARNERANKKMYKKADAGKLNRKNLRKIQKEIKRTEYGMHQNSRRMQEAQEAVKAYIDKAAKEGYTISKKKQTDVYFTGKDLTIAALTNALAAVTPLPFGVIPFDVGTSPSYRVSYQDPAVKEELKKKKQEG